MAGRGYSMVGLSQPVSSHLKSTHLLPHVLSKGFTLKLWKCVLVSEPHLFLLRAEQWVWFFCLGTKEDKLAKGKFCWNCISYLRSWALRWSRQCDLEKLRTRSQLDLSYVVTAGSAVGEPQGRAGAWSAGQPSSTCKMRVTLLLGKTQICLSCLGTHCHNMLWELSPTLAQFKSTSRRWEPTVCWALLDVEGMGYTV